MKLLTRAKKRQQSLQRVLFWYGYVLPINGQATRAGAAAVYAAHDHVVFADGLQGAAHPSHADLVAIIPLIRAINPKIKIWGYVPIGGAVGANRSEATMKAAVDDWKASGANGIFLDEFGYDYGVTRTRQNTMVDYCHGKNLAVIANGWDADHIYSSANLLSMNPTNEPHHLWCSDYCLVESFAYDVNGTGYEAPTHLHSRMAKFIGYGARIMTLSFFTYGADNNAAVKWVYDCAMFYAVDAWGVCDDHIYSNVNHNLIAFTLPTSELSCRYYCRCPVVTHNAGYTSMERYVGADRVVLTHTASERTIAINPAPVTFAIPTSGLWGLYWFDQGSGQELTDTSGNNRTGRLGSGVGVDSADPAWSGGGLTFDGGDYALVPASLDLTGDFTAYIACEVPAANPASYGTYWGAGNSADTAPRLYLYRSTSGTIGFALRNNASADVSTSLPAIAGARLFRVRRSGATYTLMDISGAAESSVKTAPASPITTTQMSFGALVRSSPDYWLNGKVYAAAFFTRATTAGDDAQVYGKMKETLSARGVTLT